MIFKMIRNRGVVDTIPMEDTDSASDDNTKDDGDKTKGAGKDTDNNKKQIRLY